jgi:hypothetical protein
VFGVQPNWIAILPVLLALLAAFAFAALATPSPRALATRDLATAVAAVGAWVVVATFGSSLTGEFNTPLDGSVSSLVLIGAGAVAGLVAVAALWRALPRRRGAQGSAVTAELAFGDRSS